MVKETCKDGARSVSNNDQTNPVLKQTEIGLIPEDWDVVNFGEVLLKNPDYGINAAAVKFKYSLPTYLRISDIDENGRFIKDNLSSVDNINSASYYLREGDVVFARTGASVGKTYLYNSADGDLVFAGFLIRVQPNHKLTNSKFLFYNTQTKMYKDWIISNSMRSGQPGINSNEIKTIKIPLPPLAEQEAIATTLSDCDAWIESLEAVIAKKRLIKQGAMQELLTPKENWEVKKLGEVIDIFRGGSPRPIQNFMTDKNDGINWIKIGDTSSSGKYIFETKEKIIPEGANFSRRVFQGDFLLSNSMSFGRPYILKIDGCVHDGWLVLSKYQDTFATEFLYYFLLSKIVIDQYKSKAAGSGVLNLNKVLVSSVELSFPSLYEQTRIATVLSDMDAELDALTQKLNKARQIKQGMTQELLTGRVRLV